MQFPEKFTKNLNIYIVQQPEDGFWVSFEARIHNGEVWFWSVPYPFDDLFQALDFIKTWYRHYLLWVG
jgi:hypothetical protein